MTTNFLLRIRFAKDTLARKEYFGGAWGWFINFSRGVKRPFLLNIVFRLKVKIGQKKSC